ncbi:Hypothetical predicted protein [Olea europaea subsp. europaea]|uniref:Uncharacterized protein n=1 Tax=Olea europaea subsp. europaea TaxID=158383 RepID=A0A8S0QE35_OLEEU|nr:Hypothetical predicted protein [Olea europaea subsp. europaea]
MASAAPPNSSNGSPSPGRQGQQSNPRLVPVSTPSTAHSGVNMTAQSSVDPTAIAKTLEQEASNVLYLMQTEYVMDLFLLFHHN